MKIICIGKLKEKYLKDALDEYKKRLTKYTKLEIIELPDSSFNEIQKNIETEGKLILGKITERDYVVTLEIEGREYTSLSFSHHLEEIEQKGNVTFVIGGSYGLSNDVLKRSNESLSFSKMTFPHQLFRVMLLEQIYRGYKIKNNESYHK